MGALLECLVFETSKVADPEIARDTAQTWVGRVWRAYLNVGDEAKTRGLASRRTAEDFEKTLTRLEARQDKGAFEVARNAIEEEASRLFLSEGTTGQTLEALVMALKAILRSNSDEVRTHGKAFAKKQLQGAITAIQQGQDERREDLLRFVAASKDLVKGDNEIQQRLDDLCLQHLPAYVPTSTSSVSLLVSHLASTSPSSRSSIWASLFATSPAPAVWLRLIDAVSKARLDADLPSAELDAEVVKIATKAMSTERAATDDELEVLRRLMLQPSPFVDASLPAQLADLAIESLTRAVSSAVDGTSDLPQTSDSVLVSATSLLANYVQVRENSDKIALSRDAAVAIARVGYLLPNCRIDAAVPGEAIAAAQQAWQEIVRSGGDDVLLKAIDSLRSLLVNVHARPSAIEVVQACAAVLSTSNSTELSLSCLLPQPALFDELYHNLSLNEPSPALSVLEPLIFASDASHQPGPSAIDSAFLTAYPRAVLGFLEIASRDHSLARKSLWIVPHLLLFTNCARDQYALSTVSTGMFGVAIPEEVLERLIGAGEGASSYLLSSATNSLPDAWHAGAVAHLRSKEPTATEDRLLAVLDGLARTAKGTDVKAAYAHRAVSTVLSAALRYSESGVQDAERWLALAQNLPSGASDCVHTCCPV